MRGVEDIGNIAPRTATVKTHSYRFEGAPPAASGDIYLIETNFTLTSPAIFWYLYATLNYLDNNGNNSVKGWYCTLRSNSGQSLYNQGFFRQEKVDVNSTKEDSWANFYTDSGKCIEYTPPGGLYLPQGEYEASLSLLGNHPISHFVRAQFYYQLEFLSYKGRRL